LFHALLGFIPTLDIMVSADIVELVNRKLIVE